MPTYGLGGVWEVSGFDLNTAWDPEVMVAANGINYPAESRFSLEERPEKLPPRLSHHPIHENNLPLYPHTQLCSSWYFPSLDMLYMYLFVIVSPPKMRALGEQRVCLQCIAPGRMLGTGSRSINIY